MWDADLDGNDALGLLEPMGRFWPPSEGSLLLPVDNLFYAVQRARKAV